MQCDPQFEAGAAYGDAESFLLALPDNAAQIVDMIGGDPMIRVQTDPELIFFAQIKLFLECVEPCQQCLRR